MHRPALLLILCALAAAAGADPYDPAAVERARLSAPVAEALAALPRQDTDAYVAGLRALDSDRALSPLDRAAAMHRAVLELATLPETAAGRILLAELSGRKTALRVRVEDGHGHHTVPAFDVAAAARFTSRQWDLRDAGRALVEELRGHSSVSTLSAKRSADPLRAPALGVAMKTAPVDVLYAQRDELLRGIPDDPALGAAALAAGQRLADADLLAAVARHAPESDARGALEALPLIHDPRGRDAIVDAALERPALASRAVFALASFADRDPDARERLFALLADPALGGSAAAALAKLDEPATAARVAERLAVTTEPTTAARLALTLRLMSNDTAAERLREFVAQPEGHQALKRQLREGLK